jgi:threonine/homoserine/homoserine lactone efflux protein
MMGSIDSQIVAVLVIAGLLALTLGADTMLVIRNLMALGRDARTPSPNPKIIAA